MWVSLRQIILCCAVVLVVSAARSVHAAAAADAEARAFAAARKPFDDKFYDLAEQQFADFVAKYPGSPRVSQALLFRAQAALAQKKFPIALDLLVTNIANAAGLADQFQLWIARTHVENGKPAAAADAFALLVASYTNSTLRLEATLGEAQARFDLQQWPRVVDLLQNPSGVFQLAAARAPNSQDAVQGRLLLAEALLKQRNYAAAERTGASIPDSNLTSKVRWQRDYLVAQAQFSAQKVNEALARSSNLVSLAASIRDPVLESAGVALQGEILEALNQPAAAIAAYDLNQRAGMPPERVREALFKTVELTVAQGQLTNALVRLKTFLDEHRSEAGSDAALLATAELRLKQYQLQTTGTNGAAAVPAATNLLAEAITNCDRVLREFTNTVFTGQAQLLRAWASLLQGNHGEGLASFRAAADTLPLSDAQAVARFKVADLEFQSGELTNALRDYRRVLGQYHAFPRVQSELVPHARYQMLQASLGARDLAAAQEAVEPIVREYPVTDFTERTLLRYGQVIEELENPAAARKVFAKFITRFPNSSLRPQVELAIARSYERERDWAGAIARYDAWVTAFPTNEDLASAEFRRASAYDHAGQATNGLLLFTNFVARFPSNELAQRAQEWIGDFWYLREQFQAAERSYQLVYQNWPAGPLGYVAKLKAGRAALMRQSYGDAVQYFTDLIEKKDCPDSVLVGAYFAYGDAFRLYGSTNPIERFQTALTIYERIPKFRDPRVPLAWGLMANCYFQLGTNNPANFPQALVYYGKVTNEPTAELSARMEAIVGLGNVQREQARLARDSGATSDARALVDAAAKSYLSVLYADYDAEAPDPFWLKKAAMSAAEIAESQEKWEQAIKVYERLIDMLPALRSNPILERRISTAREKAALKRQAA